MNTHAAIVKYVADLSGNPRTRRSYIDSLERFERYKIKVDNDVLAGFYKALATDDKRYMQGTVNVRIVVLRGFLRWAEVNGLTPKTFNRDVAESRFKAVRVGHQNAYRYKTADSRIPDIVHYFDDMDAKQGPTWERLDILRNRAIVHVLISTGVRVSELLSLTRGMIADGSQSELEICGKRGKIRPIYLDAAACKAVMAYCRAREDECQALFVTHRWSECKPLRTNGVYYMIKLAAKACGLSKNTSAHMFRHWLAMDMVEHDVPIETIKEVLGHERIETTMIYARSSRLRVRSQVMQYRAKTANGTNGVK